MFLVLGGGGWGAMGGGVTRVEEGTVSICWC